MTQEQTIRLKYDIARTTPIDIHEHIEYIYGLALQCNHIIEAGVRYVVSTWPLILGCALKGGEVHSYDINTSPEIEEAKKICTGLNWTFHHCNWLDIEIPETDMLFIDTYHTYTQLKAELTKHAHKARKYLIFHDTETFGSVGMDGRQPGLQQAIHEYQQEHPEWKTLSHRSNCNGLTTLRRLPQ